MEKIGKEYFRINVPCIDCPEGCRGGCWNKEYLYKCDYLREYISDIIKLYKTNLVKKIDEAIG